MNGGEMGPQVAFAYPCRADNARNKDAPDVLEVSAPCFRDERKWNETAGNHTYENRDHIPNWDIDSEDCRRDKQPEEKTST